MKTPGRLQQVHIQKQKVQRQTNKLLQSQIKGQVQWLLDPNLYKNAISDKDGDNFRRNLLMANPFLDPHINMMIS